ncbi:MAG: hypothetical protein HKN26_13015 [Acidimicrobiales bacterium]|nr:hypothetical protein [Acidimicrobiales bacterium]
MFKTETTQPALQTKPSTVQFGYLLRWRRLEAGHSLRQASAVSRVEAEVISAIEHGERETYAAEVNLLLDLYTPTEQNARLAKSNVHVDLERGEVAISKPKGHGPSRRAAREQSDSDRALVNYLAMLHDFHGDRLYEAVPFQQVDLSLLRNTLAERRNEVAAHLDRIDPDAAHEASWLRELLRDHGRPIAAVVGAAAIAGAIWVASSDGTIEPAPAPAPTTVTDVVLPPEPGFGPAIVSERGPTVPAQNPEVEIGTAIVVERQPVTEERSGD